MARSSSAQTAYSATLGHNTNELSMAGSSSSLQGDSQHGLVTTVTNCSFCGYKFGWLLFKRRHHCRICSPNFACLESGEKPVRVCAPCMTNAPQEVEPVMGLHTVVYNLNGTVVFGSETFIEAPTAQQLKFRHMAARGNGPIFMTLLLNEQELTDLDIVMGGTPECPVILTAMHATFALFKHSARHQWALFDEQRRDCFDGFSGYLNNLRRDLQLAYDEQLSVWTDKKQREGTTMRVNMDSGTPGVSYDVVVNSLDTVSEVLEACKHQYNEPLRGGVWSWNGLDLKEDATLASFAIPDAASLKFNPGLQPPPLRGLNDLHPIGIAFNDLEELAERITRLRMRICAN